MKISPIGTELFHVNGRTGITKLIAAFRNSAKALNDGAQIVDSPIGFETEVHL
jgi:hypothetical protein